MLDKYNYWVDVRYIEGARCCCFLMSLLFFYVCQKVRLGFLHAGSVRRLAAFNTTENIGTLSLTLTQLLYLNMTIGNVIMIETGTGAKF
jgi:hypothetical protein